MGRLWTVRDLPLGDRGWVDAIVRDGREFRPRGRDRIRGGDDLVVTPEDEAGRSASAGYCNSLVRKGVKRCDAGRGATSCS
jgi:NhaP-type Na+/H+ and K+/H+ antiporter